MNKKIFISIIIVVLVIILGILLWNNRQSTKNTENKVDEFQNITNEDDSKSIMSDLDQIEIDSTIDTEINPIDEELKNL